MTPPTSDNEKIQAFHRVRNLIPSRERIEELRRVARSLEAAAEVATEGTKWAFHEDAALCDKMADLLLDIRQAVKGGRKEIRGSRHWTEP